MGSQQVCVVGSDGFIGRHVVQDLLDAGHVVHTFDRRTRALDPQDPDDVVLEADHVVWAAATINPMVADNDPSQVQVDVAFFQTFLDTMRDRGRGRTILLSSGGTVYDQSVAPPYAESSPVGPSSAYGAAKLEIEERLLATDPRPLVLRVANPYGAGQPVASGQGVIAHRLDSVMAGVPLQVYGDLTLARDYVHVEDVARAVTLAVGTRCEERVLNIGTGTPTTLSGLLDIVTQAVGERMVPVEHHESRRFDATSTWLDCSLAAEAIGWQPVWDLASGVASMWRSIAHATTVAEPLAAVSEPAPAG